MKLTTPEISWHGKEPLFSLDFSSHGKVTRLATAGADFYIRIWCVDSDEEGTTKVDFRANLLRHTKTVNVVRFSPEGNLLASGSDDCFVILWRLNESSERNSFTQSSNMNSDEVGSKESWQVVKMLRGHIEDVYDLAWSPSGLQLISGSVDNSVIIWDTTKGEKLKLLKDHRQYVQGVCWDPCGSYIASYSSDRTCRIYTTNNFRCCYNVNKVTIPQPSTTPDSGNQNTTKQIKLFHDETMPSFFRRLAFSPDGSLLIVPGGRFEVNEQPINTTFVFTKASLNKPVMYFPATKKPTIAVRCCPMLFQLRKTAENTKGEDDTSQAETKSVFKLPYRMVIAVASLDSVVLYDTQHTCPFAYLSNMHYASLTDIAWSGDGKLLAVSSRDGYCSLVCFENDELGMPYGQTACEVMKKVTPVKAVRPAFTKESSIEKDVSPKIESLSIKKFMTVNPGRPSPRPSPLPTTTTPGQKTSPSSNTIITTNTIPSAHGHKISPSTTSILPSSQNTSPSNNPAPRRISFVTLKPSTISARPQPTTTTPQPTNTDNSDMPKMNTANAGVSYGISSSSENQGSTTTTPEVMGSVTKVTQPRRVGFVTLPQPGQSLERPGKPPVPLEPVVIVIND